jgi:hypothetical protein
MLDRAYRSECSLSGRAIAQLRWTCVFVPTTLASDFLKRCHIIWLSGLNFLHASVLESHALPDGLPRRRSSLSAAARPLGLALPESRSRYPLSGAYSSLGDIYLASDD